MRVPTLDGLRALIACEQGPCVSLYLPTVQGGSPDDASHFHAELRRLKLQLQQTETSATVDELLRPLEALSTPDFWREAKSTLVAYRSMTTLTHWHLPVELPELVSVGPKAVICPLLSHLQANRRFYLLAMNGERAILYRGSAFQLEPVHVELQEALVPVGAGRGAEECADPLPRVRAIERGVAQAMAELPLPLLVSAPERELWMFRSVARFEDMVSFGLVGDMVEMAPEALHARAWPMVQAHLEDREVDVLDRWGLLSTSNRATDDLTAIARASAMGRVRELIVDREAVVLGHLDRETGLLLGANRRERNNVLEELAESVCLHGGEVFRLRHDRMPTRSPIAATLRW